MSSTNAIDLQFTGTFSLATSVSVAARASFIGDSSRTQGDAGVLELAFLLEDSPVGVRVSQDDAGVHARVFANPGGAAKGEVRTQLERILSLDVEGTGFAEVTARDEVVAGLEQRYPGLRPLLYSSPYEAAARMIIGHRLAVKQAAAVTDRLAEEHGVRVEVGDHVMHTFPAPERLADLPPIQGLAERKVEQLRVLGAAAASGQLSLTRLRELARDEVLSYLQELPGIGPFSAEFILIRGVGDPDIFPRTEKSLHRAMATVYHLGDEPDLATLERLAGQWRPYRSWVGLLLRNFRENSS